MLERQLECRRAIESLRSGVPNSEAVRILGSGQTHVLESFDRALEEARNLNVTTATGTIVSGGFGTGKSHLLEELRDRAIRRGFAVSSIAISKETPLNA